MSKTICFYKIITILLLELVSIASFCQIELPKFKRLSTNDGLSQGHVAAILKDRRGFMWFGTDEGLNRYDGYNFKVYKHDPEVSASICNNFILDLLEDRAGNLWICTSNGLDKYEWNKDSFTHYPNGSVSMNIRDIFEDSRGKIWLASTDGFYSFDVFTKRFRQYQHAANDTNSLTNNFTNRIAEDNQGKLWIGSRDGLNRFDTKTNQFTHYRHNPKDKKSISNSCIKALFKDHKGQIWVGTQGGGIALFNEHDNSFTNFVHDPSNKNSISHNDILAFTEDRKNRLWVGTENGGISVYDPANKLFDTYQFDPANNSSLSSNSIHSLYLDNIGNIWVGTWSGGVNFLPKFNEKFELYRQVSYQQNSLSNNMVLSIGGDSSGYIWIGTDGGGLNRFNPVTKRFDHFSMNRNSSNSLLTDYVTCTIDINKDVIGIGFHRSGFQFYNKRTGGFSEIPPDRNMVSLSNVSLSVIFKDSDGNLWFGTHDRGGLYFYDMKKKLFTVYQPNSLNKASNSASSILCILENKQRDIWIGTDNGLDFFDRKTGHFIHYENDIKNEHSISSNVVYSIIEDQAGNLWLGTNSGLNFLDKNTGKFTEYNERDGLPNNVIYSILMDKRQNLWLSSNKGLSCFNTVTKKSRNYKITDGLQDNSFKPHCSYKNEAGKMFFGGVNGLNMFDPDSVKDNDFIPPVMITDFRIFNKTVIPGEKEGPLTQQISETKEITLSYDQSVLTFEFSALNYTLPEENQYAYKLQGFDKDWNYSLNKRSATYTNLDPGHYVLLVKASNNDGAWNNNPATLQITITPPFWLTWYFKLLAAIVLISAAFATYKWRIRVMSAQKKKLQVLVQERTAQLVHITEQEKKARFEAENANKSKSVFLATMSHEIRTPMNGVIGMAALLTETELNAEQKSYAETITSCGESLLNVINDILDFSKIESDSVELENIDFNLRECIEEVLDVFALKAAKTGLDIIYEISPAVPAQLIGDALRLRQILMNLISNAIKFTKAGEIFIEVNLLSTREDKQIELQFQVSDTGIGIPPDKMERLFKPFSQVDSSTTRKYGGTGLGLVISEKLVKLMGGEIHVISQAGMGTNFSFTILTREGSAIINTNTFDSIYSLKGKRVLVVDDNATNLKILKKQLEAWKLLPVLAENGNRALEILSNSEAFDLVLTDMEMPQMNGLELSRTVRSRYPSIPVILLSSMGDDSLKRYPGLFRSVLTKPIRQNILYSSIVNQFTQPANAGSGEKNTAYQLSGDFSKTHPLKILIAEDNVINQQLAMKVLVKLGYLPDIVENGKEVLDALDHTTYDLILMDIQMPEMDGMQATIAIRQQQLAVQPTIIAMTANAMQGDEAACLEAGMDDYLSKPVRLEQLLLKLEKWTVKKPLQLVGEV